MTDALDKAFAEAERSLISCKSAGPSIAAITTSSAGYNTQPLSLTRSRLQLDELRGWVWAAVRLVAQKVAQQTLCVGRPARSGRRVKGIGKRVAPMDGHPLLDAMASPNPWMSYWQLMFVSICSLEVTGRALWYVDTDDEPASIYFLPTPWIWQIDPLQRWWKIRPTHSTDEFTIPGESVVNLHYPACDGNYPNDVISPLARVSEAVLTDKAIQTAQHSSFKNGINPSAIITLGKLAGMNGQLGERPVLTPQQREDLFTAVRMAYSGVHAEGQPMILDGLVESITKWSNTVTEMAYGDSGKTTKSRILESYGVSEVLLGNLLNANRASSTVSSEVVIVQKINPILEMLSGTLTQRLGPMFARPREKLTVWIEPAVPDDVESEIKKYDLASRFGYITANEYRVNVLNLPPIEGGDVRLQPAGFLPADEPDDDDADDDDATKRAKRLRRRKDDDDICDDIEDGVCPACGGELNEDDVCTQCGEDWSDYDCDDKGHVSRNGHANRLTAS